jgi:RNA polymerase sigma-70 factor (ECF subfamily)
MADQDRGRWDRHMIESGFEHFAASASGQRLTSTHVMAAIAAEHARAPDYAATDWTGIVAYYDMLIALDPSPVHCLNRAVAVMESGRLEFAFAEIERLKDDPFLARFHLLHATRAEALTRLGRRDEAAAALEAALSGTMSAPARRLLVGRLAELQA